MAQLRDSDTCIILCLYAYLCSFQRKIQRENQTNPAVIQGGPVHIHEHAQA